MIPTINSVMKISWIQLILILTCLCSPMVFSLMAPETIIAPLQVSDTTWEMLESEFPDAVFIDVSFLNSSHGWIAGRTNSDYSSNAIVLHTGDGGDSWQLQYNRSSQWITVMDVVDEQTVWITGFGSLFYTTNGGDTWNESVVVGGMKGLSAVKFINATHGWTSNNGILYYTMNSGHSWETVEGWDSGDSPRMIQNLSALNLWASGFNGIYHSLDGGVTWEKVSNRGGWTISFVTETEGWTVDDSRLAHTTDGSTWEELPIPGRVPFTDFRLRSPYLTDVQFVDESNGWIVGDEIPVLYTPDGGVNWYEQSVPSDVNSRVMAVDFIDETHGWAVGSGVIMRTRTGNDLGNRLWSGMTDPLFLAIVIVSAIAVTSVIAIFWLRRKRTSIENKPQSPSIE